MFLLPHLIRRSIPQSFTYITQGLLKFIKNQCPLEVERVEIVALKGDQ